MSYVGASVKRIEDRRLLTGSGRYVADVRLSGTLHAAVFRSSQAHAHIRRIYVDRARSLPGVSAVFTAADLGPVGRIPMRLAPRPALQACFQRPFPDERVRYVGEPLALVVACSRYVAEDALDLIEVDLDPLPVIADARQGMQPGAVPLHPALEGNLAERIVMHVGDAAAALARAPVTLRASLAVQRHTGIPIETRGLLAQYDRSADMLNVWGPTKVVHFNRRILADLLHRPESAIRFIETDVGGGFGPRGEFYPEDFLIPWAAVALGRPVQWVEDRREHFMATNHSREQVHDVEVGVEWDGTIVALVTHAVVDMGAYIRTNGFVVPERAAGFLPGPYRVRNYTAEVDCVMTNKTPTGSYRGPGRYECGFVRERIMDLVAREVGIDPADVRRRNFVQPEEMPYNVGTKAFNHDVVYDSGDYPALFETALKALDYPRVRAEQAEARGQGKYVGIGIGCLVEKSGVGPWESARVQIDGSGHVVVFTGVAAVGQGMETTMAQICADVIGVKPESITVRHGDTALVPYGVGAFASRGAVVGGTAVLEASRRLRSKVTQLAAHILEANAEDLVVQDGAVTVRGAGAHAVTFKDLARACMPGPSLPSGMEPGLEGSYFFEVSNTPHPYGTHLAVVEVDPDLGRVTVLRYLIAYDIGKAINPALVEGQLVGGLAQGLGGALLEDLVYDAHGQLLTASFMDYLLPTAVEVPPRLDVLILEDAPSPLNPLGLKGAGEGGTVGAGGALANAVEDALAPLGVRVRRLPLSPDAVRRLVVEARA
jgi:carbon-monoxide dehydrogenase large subunit